MAPNLDDVKQYLLRPVLSTPPLCSYADSRVMSLEDLADLHEALDLRIANAQKIAKANRRK